MNGLTNTKPTIWQKVNGSFLALAPFASRKSGLGLTITHSRFGVVVARHIGSKAVKRKEMQMDTTTLIILIVVLLLVFGGGGGYLWSRGRRLP